MALSIPAVSLRHNHEHSFLRLGLSFSSKPHLNLICLSDPVRGALNPQHLREPTTGDISHIGWGRGHISLTACAATWTMSIAGGRPQVATPSINSCLCWFLDSADDSPLWDIERMSVHTSLAIQCEQHGILRAKQMPWSATNPSTMHREATNCFNPIHKRLLNQPQTRAERFEAEELEETALRQRVILGSTINIHMPTVDFDTKLTTTTAYSVRWYF